MAGQEVIELDGLKRLLEVIAADSSVEHIGLLFGRGSRVLVYVPLRNVYGARDRFQGDAWDIVVAFTMAERYGLELVAVYHNHPCGEPRPSKYDLEGMKRWPYIWVIASKREIRAWKQTSRGLVEVGVTG
ncbi:MAG: Mov34/MPN/PAD-1 family protein [Desulfurococcales archaeon]|nr:Mov34/MPN/PAD-1 family protein [Desulfurococcales archaeon]